MKVQNMVPDIYYRESRDFSLIGRLFEIVFNYMKTGADVVAVPVTSENATTLMVQLMMTSFGFKNTEDYQNKDLIALISMFIEIIRGKGSITSIKKLVKLLYQLEKIDAKVIVKCKSGDKTIIQISLNHAFKNERLLQHMLDYILPVGMIYEFKTADIEANSSTSVKASALIKPYVVNESDLGRVYSREADMKTSFKLDDAPKTRSMTTLGLIVSSVDQPSSSTEEDTDNE